jgi:hypothetical protein
MTESITAPDAQVVFQCDGATVTRAQIVTREGTLAIDDVYGVERRKFSARNQSFVVGLGLAAAHVVGRLKLIVFVLTPYLIYMAYSVYRSRSRRSVVLHVRGGDDKYVLNDATPSDAAAFADAVERVLRERNAGAA